MDNPTPFESPAGDSDTPPPTAPVHSDGWHYTANGFERYQDGRPIATATADAIAEKLTNALELARTLGDRITRLESEQIDGSDPRLANFWAKAQELADNANHCEVFDNIAEALGGPRRTREYFVNVSGYVTVPVTYSFTVEASDPDEAREQAEELFSDMDASDLEDYADWYSADLDTYSVTSEAELN